MGIRSAKRQVAKARMEIMGVGNVNAMMGVVRDGVPNWKRALYGKTGQAAWKAQMNHGRLLKAKDEARKTLAKRKMRKVEA